MKGVIKSSRRVSAVKLVCNSAMKSKLLVYS